MKKSKNSQTTNSRMIKIVYFDESSATDYLYVMDGGKSQNKEEHIVTKTTEIATGAEAQAGARLGVVTAITAKLGIEGNADFSREGSKIISKAIESTVLTDYLSCSEKNKDKHIHIFSDCQPYPYPESFSYFKMITPYLIMTEGKVPVAQGLNINLSMIDQALDSGRGYYELVADISDKKVVLRFNTSAFRNNYSLSDLTKMRLTYHAIEVGTITPAKLTMKNEFGKGDESEISGYDIVDEDADSDNIEMKVYDVVLAGVCK